LSNETNIGEKDLLARVAAGDEQAFSVLYNSHKQMVYNIAWSFAKNQAMAEDILQDVFVLVWKKRGLLPGIRDFSAYLFIIVRNQSFNVLKRMASERKKGERVTGYQTGFEPFHNQRLTQNEMEELLSHGMDLLTPQQRRVFELRRLEGCPPQEISETMGISKNTVGVHLNLALKTLRAFLLTNLDFYIGLAVFFSLF
jgi:RNA polymerase sigma-70 factor (family 1)